MNCSNPILYTIQYGDSLYNLANRYNTTVEDIIASNTYLNPYNLMVGSQIVICLNSKSTTTENIPTMTLKSLALLKEMNSLWEQHVFWTRLLLISIAEDLKDLDYTQKRLLRNPVDIANVYRRFYGEEVANKIEKLLTEHLVIGANLITALKNNNTTLASNLTQKWYRNADDMAEAFSSINPYYAKEDIKQMLYSHLQLTSQEVEARLRGDYAADIEAFDKVQNEILKMSEYLAVGILKQIPDMFI